jgi:CheY-like chemotaxis protein
MDREQRSLLVVDGSASYLFYMAMVLKKLEYAVKTATTAEDALQSMKGSPPSLVITDTVLPYMSGVNLLKAMKQNTQLKAIPVIMHTLQNDSGVREACGLAGCAGYFIKPADPDVLYRSIQAATESMPRQTIRIDTSLKVFVGDSAGSAGAVRREEVTTISDGGLYIKSLIPEPVNAVLPLTIVIRAREIRAKAVVLYSSVKIGGPHKVPGMGMRFVSISEEDKAFIANFIKEQITKGLAPMK